MARLLRSPWVLASLALVFGLGTQAGVLAWRLGLVGGHHAEPPPEPAPAPDTLSWSFVTPEVDRLRGELESRLTAADARRRELEDYERRLQAERAEIEKLKRDLERMRAELDRAREEFAASITEIQAAEQKNLKTLAATYTNLSPAGAIAIFREMEDQAVVKILAFMKPDPVGQILEEMARTKEGDTTLAARAAEISNRLRLLRQVKPQENT